MAIHYTEGPIGPVMLKTGCSMLMGTLSISGYNIADTYFVSQLGKLPLAAMGYTFPVVMLIGCLYHGLGAGVMTPTAQLLGAENRSRAARLVSSGLELIVLVGVLIGLIGLATLGATFRFFGASDEVMPMIASYMVVWYCGGVTGALAGVGNSLLIAAGSARTASFMMLVGMLLNVGMDPWFIYGGFGLPAMGITGAAAATVLSQLICASLVLGILHQRQHLVGSFRQSFRSLMVFWGIIWRYAVPSALGMLLMPIGSTVVTRAVASLGGDTAVAATAAAGRLESIAFIFPMALGMSLLPMIGQNFGAGKFDRINQCRRFAMRFASLFLGCMALLYFVLAPQLVSFFTSDAQVLAVMIRYLRIVAWGFAGIEIHRYSTFFFTGCGKPMRATLLNMLRVAGLLIPLTLWAQAADSLDGVFWARLAADVLAGSIGCYCAHRLTRRLLGGYARIR